MRGFFLLFLMLTSCIQYSLSKREIPSTLLPYVEAWENESGYYVQFKIEINNDLTEQVGLCSIQYSRNILGQIDGSYRVVQIKYSYFDNMTVQQRQMGLEQVINHELEHCVKDRMDHNNSLLTDGCPASIMYMYTFGHTKCYTKYRAMYWDEIRNVKK